MQIGAILLLIVLVLTGIFAALNWTAIITPTALWLGVTTVQAPLGLVLLGALALVALIFIGSAIALQGRAIMEMRRQSRELQVQRQLADQAEASRFTELRGFVSTELQRVTQSADAARDGVLARLERLEAQQRALIEQTGNTLSAYIGQLEERMTRAQEPTPEPAGRELEQPPG